MIHHEAITAILAPKHGEGDTGVFDVFELVDADGFQVFEGGRHVCDCDTLEDAVAAAEKEADDFNWRQLEDLKRRWREGPNWDIEATEGYEYFRQELYIFRLETERDSALRELQQMRAVLTSFAALLPRT